ncbi:MAG: hypothetical protein OXG91_03655 [bacterium]|nr:hypothetical protein [bacterium]MCY3924190.1 hypothetical protein [bacterium]
MSDVPARLHAAPAERALGSSRSSIRQPAKNRDICGCGPPRHPFTQGRHIDMLTGHVPRSVDPLKQFG